MGMSVAADGGPGRQHEVIDIGPGSPEYVGTECTPVLYGSSTTVHALGGPQQLVIQLHRDEHRDRIEIHADAWIIQIERTARAYGWSPAFVKALAWQESGWQQHVTSSAGAVGIMQVLPETGAFVSRRAGRTFDLHNPADNVEAGVAFLDYLYGVTGRNAELTLAGYYQGLASVRHNGVFPATEQFIANVLALRERFR
jgi:hypothetical protein